MSDTDEPVAESADEIVEAADEQPVEPEPPFVETDVEKEARVEAFDLDHDGKVSFVEGARAQLGVVDARLEEAAKDGGLKGKTAEVAHHLLDKLDND
jgi:hypothetical protein